MPKRFFRLSLLAVLAILLLSGCTFPWWKKTAPAATSGQSTDGNVSTTTSITVTNTSKLKKFDNYEQLAEFLAANNNPEVGVTRGLALDSQMKVAALSTAVSQNSASADESGRGTVNSLG